MFAYAAYFRNEAPAAFQIWRPMSAGSKQFKLISSLEVVPAVDKAVEQVRHEKQHCLLHLLLRRQDTVDFLTSEHPLAQSVSYCKNSIPLCSG